MGKIIGGIIVGVIVLAIGEMLFPKAAPVTNIYNYWSKPAYRQQKRAEKHSSLAPLDGMSTLT
jgi:hypothetical protein